MTINRKIMEIINKRNYYTSRIGMSLLIFIGFVLIQVFSSSFGLGWLVLLIGTELIYLSSKFTSRIRLDENNIIISYFSFFSKREINISTTGAEIKLLKSASLRSAGHYILKIIVGSRTVYELDSRDGFSDEELIAFHTAYIVLKSKHQ